MCNNPKERKRPTKGFQNSATRKEKSATGRAPGAKVRQIGNTTRT